MRARVSFIVGAIVATGVFGAPAASGEAEPSALVSSPWTKFCFNEICLTGTGVRTDLGCGRTVAAVLIEAGSGRRILRITVPNAVNAASSVRVSVDQNPPIERPYRQCDSNGCLADMTDDPGLIGLLRQGRMLVIQAVGPDLSPIVWTLPLAGFAVAYDGLPQAPQLFKPEPGQLEKELKAQQEGQQPTAPRATRCEEK